MVVVFQWNSPKAALGLGTSDHSLIQALNEDTRHLCIIRDYIMEVDEGDHFHDVICNDAEMEVVPFSTSMT